MKDIHGNDIRTGKNNLTPCSGGILTSKTGFTPCKYSEDCDGINHFMKKKNE